MKTAKPSAMNRPFRNLKSFLEERDVPLRSFPVERVLLDKKAARRMAGPENEEALFEAAMADVFPLEKDNVPEFDFEPHDRPCVSRQNPPDATLVKMENLVKHGEGFVVEYTAEYIEGAGPDVRREIVTKLHQGEFSIQGYIDLHGFNVEQAREAFDNFLKDSVASAKRGVLIVHGRGLSSPEEPVLKTKVFHWLTRGPWRKWVVAFCSARSCDGGAGATYVLLRRTPVTKKRRKKGTRAI